MMQNVQSGMDVSWYEIVDDKNNDESFIYYMEWNPGVLHFWNKELYNGSNSGEERIADAERFFKIYIKTAPIVQQLGLEIEFDD